MVLTALARKCFARHTGLGARGERERKDLLEAVDLLMMEEQVLRSVHPAYVRAGTDL